MTGPANYNMSEKFKKSLKSRSAKYWKKVGEPCSKREQQLIDARGYGLKKMPTDEELVLLYKKIVRKKESELLQNFVRWYKVPGISFDDDVFDIYKTKHFTDDTFRLFFPYIPKPSVKEMFDALDATLFTPLPEKSSSSSKKGIKHGRKGKENIQ